MTRRFAGVHFIFIPDRRRIQNSLISVATAYQPGINAQKCSKTLNSKHKKRPVSLKTNRFGPSVEIRYILIPEKESESMSCRHTAVGKQLSTGQLHLIVRIPY